MSINSPLLPSCLELLLMMSLLQSARKMFVSLMSIYLPKISKEMVRWRTWADCRIHSQTLRFVQSLPKRDRIPFSTKFKNADPLALDLLERMLVFDPRKRINATEALANEYLAPYHDPTDEPIANEPFDWSFNDADLPIDTWRVMMYSEILGAFTLFLLPAGSSLASSCPSHVLMLGSCLASRLSRCEGAACRTGASSASSRASPSYRIQLKRLIRTPLPTIMH